MGRALEPKLRSSLSLNPAGSADRTLPAAEERVLDRLKRRRCRAVRSRVPRMRKHRTSKVSWR